MRRKNRPTTAITNAIDTTSVNCTSRTDARIVAVWSKIGTVSMPAGIQRASSGRIALTRSTVSITLAPGWRKIWTSTARRSPNQAAWRSFSTPANTLATSPKRTVRPLAARSRIAR